MEEFLIYLLKSTALLSLFYLVYVLLLKKDTDFVANRKFLFGGIVAAAILPAITFTRKIWVEPVSNYTATGITETSVNEASPIFNIWEFAGWIYMIVTLILLLRLGFQLISVIKLISAHPIQRNQSYYLIETTKDFPPFSFFWFIIYNPDAHSKKELDLILCHEKVHARQKHSIDVLFANLTTALLWFNPLSWFYKKSIEQNLEFIADKETVAASGEKTAYQRTLVKITARNFPPPLTNQFYQSLIKKRILMLNKNQKYNQQPWKMMLLFPFILAFMLSFNVKTEARILKSGDNKYSSISEEDQQILEAHFSEKTTEKDLEKYKKAFAEKNVKLDWDQVLFSENKLKKIHITYTLETGDSRSFKSETDENNHLIPFKIGAKFHENAKVAFIAIGNKKPGQKTEEQLVKKVVKPDSEQNLPQNLVYMIDGKEVEKEVLDKLDPELIAEINVLKDKKAIEEVGKKGKNGVIMVKTKKRQETNVENKSQGAIERTKVKIRELDKKDVLPISADSLIAFQPTKIETTKTGIRNPQPNFQSDKTAQPMVIVEGEEKDMEYLKRSIQPTDIKSMNVIRGSAAIEKYGKKAAGGAIEVKLKE
ncbi:MAG: M56 family metallopeptidase [Salegentibacter sp.]|uniref:M56 family metallopeptidase n=1 Tax=Salegentibacter sp. TaxID=1903072 RepID=UPI0028709940|nr:M56 family metallopeptidase [Salegentibacter sp.]MDR9456799.1 M56 family metallopeptidase [Salegentibacter sp.]